MILSDPPSPEEPYLFWRLADEFGFEFAGEAAMYMRLHMLIFNSTYSEAVNAFKRHRGIDSDLK